MPAIYLVTSVGVALRNTFRVRFCSSTTLDVAIYLHSPQIEVCLLCARVVLGTTIDIAIRFMSRPSFLPCMTLDIIVCLHSPQTGVCLLCART